MSMMNVPDNALTIKGAAEFAAGFVFGMTADNHLSEIESCFTGGELMFHEIDAGIADIRKSGWESDLTAVFELGLVVMQLP